MQTATEYRSPLHRMAGTTATCLWNDSASLEELTYALVDGAVGATCNPVIVLEVLKREMGLWKDRIRQLVREMPRATKSQIGWRLVEDFRPFGGAAKTCVRPGKRPNGRLSIQTDPRLYRNTEALVEQAVHFSELAPNMIVKLPATAARIPAIEEATYRGVCINATVSFSLPQSITVAQAVECGLARRERESKSVGTTGAVCTIMVGRGSTTG